MSHPLDDSSESHGERDDGLAADPYDPASIEPKWQRYWLEEEVFRVEIDPSKEKAYVLDMFPYPSGAGLHVGHPAGYTATDTYCRYLRATGRNVLHPMGWDAFGLPAEQYAIQTGTHPAVTTQQNINNFRRQIQRLGYAYDWSREVNTTDLSYVRWTQWIFLKLYDMGLAYQAEVPVNWCPALGTVLANEEVIDGLSERGQHPVVRMPMRQWMLRITAYAQRLLDGVDGLDWPEGIKAMQRNWIGRSEGAEVDFALDRVDCHDGDKLTDGPIRVFTTRPDTLYGATYMVLAPEHELVAAITTASQREAVQAYVSAASRLSERDRTDERKAKTGVFTGAYAINPVNDARVPVWIADYVLSGYGTGAIMAVPGHDERDFAFATTYGLPIVRVVVRAGGSKDDPLDAAESGYGVACHSGHLDGLPTKVAKDKAIDWLEERGLGERHINFKLRDWVFSRQRYWGEPIPIVYPCSPGAGADRELFDPRRGHPVDIDYNSPTAVDVSELPIALPETDDFKPTGDAQPPLARALTWRFFERDGQWWARETNTMPQWAGSCWYYLRYLDPDCEIGLAEPAAIDYWSQVDLYVGGAEHAVLHLLYARFWHKVLFDCGVVPDDEPFPRLVNQGLILGEDGEKMSKSRGNVVNPDDVIDQFGTDAFRLYILFMGPVEKSKPWQSSGLQGTRRFLKRVWALFAKPMVNDDIPAELDSLVHGAIKGVGEDLAELRFNTAISKLMELCNALLKRDVIERDLATVYARLLAPLAPHLAEELWERLGEQAPVLDAHWPGHDEGKIVEATYELPVMVNGKVRARLTVAQDASQDQLEVWALADDRIQKWLDGKAPRKVIVIPGKMVSIVA